MPNISTSGKRLMIYTCNVPGLITTAVGGGSVGGSVVEGEGLEL